MRYCKSTIFQANHNGFFFLYFFSLLFAILQKYDFSSKSQQLTIIGERSTSCLRYCKSTIFQANHNCPCWCLAACVLFAILQKYDFSSKSQHVIKFKNMQVSCLRYCKSTIFQANHNKTCSFLSFRRLFAILQKYDFSSKSQQSKNVIRNYLSCLRYCKSTIFQANHNANRVVPRHLRVVCDTAKVRFFKQITT